LNVHNLRSKSMLLPASPDFLTLCRAI